MNTTVTDEQVRQLAETAKPYSLALLWWGRMTRWPWNFVAAF